MWTWPATGRTFTKYPSHTWMSIPLPLTTFTCCCRVWGLETRKPLSTCWSPWSSSSGLWGLQWLSFYTPLFFATLSPCHNEVAEGGYSCWNQLVCLAVFMHVVGQNHKHTYTSLQCAYTCTPPPPTPDPLTLSERWTRCWPDKAAQDVRGWVVLALLLIFSHIVPPPYPHPLPPPSWRREVYFEVLPPLHPSHPKKKEKEKMEKPRHDIYLHGWVETIFWHTAPPPPPKKKNDNKKQLNIVYLCI